MRQFSTPRRVRNIFNNPLSRRSQSTIKSRSTNKSSSLRNPSSSTKRVSTESRNQQLRSYRYSSSPSSSRSRSRSHTRPKSLKRDSSSSRESSLSQKTSSESLVRKRLKSTSSLTSRSTNSFSLLNSAPIKESDTIVCRRGIQNSGNTCFLNSAVQSLSHTKLLRHYFLKHSFSKCDISESFSMLLKKLWTSDTRATNALSLKRAVSKKSPQFRGYSQHDAAEFMQSLLDGLHNELNRVKKKPPYHEIKDIDGELISETSRRWLDYHIQRDDSIVYDLFGFQLHSSLTCKSCGHVSSSFDMSCILPVEIPSRFGKVSIQTCLNAFFGKERIHEMKCNGCKRQSSGYKQLSFFSTPDILVLQLKRFGASGRSKLNTSVSFPINEVFPVDKWVDSHSTFSKSTSYRLRSVISHSGSLQFGHYTAYARGTDDNWYHFNDERCSSSHYSGGSSAYVLIFERV